MGVRRERVLTKVTNHNQLECDAQAESVATGSDVTKARQRVPHIHKLSRRVQHQNEAAGHWFQNHLTVRCHGTQSGQHLLPRE